MLKKILITGFIFTLAGASTLSWLSWRETRWQKLRQQYRAKYAAAFTDYLHEYNQRLELPENQRDKLPWESDDNQANITFEQLNKTQHERFVADLDRLGSLEPHLYPLARVMYGDDWQEKLQQHNRKDELEKVFFAGSVICCSVGGALALSSLSGICISKISTERRRRVLQVKPNDSKQQAASIEQSESAEEEKSEKISLAGILDCHSYSSDHAQDTATADEEKAEQPVAANQQVSGSGDSTKNLYTDKESLEQKESRQTVRVKLAEILGRKKNKADDSDNTPFGSEPQGRRQDSFFDSYRSVTQAKDNINRSAKKFSKEARAAKKIAEQQPDLLNDTLNRLTEEVAAIRQHAGQQDDRVKKLQEGHDWNIIRNFGLRVIRCVDNLDRRINILSENGHPTEHLEEIRDELLFALESSGLEQYEPQVRSDYRGQEKTAEAVKARQDTDEHDLRGRIADIVRCGYRYVVDDENFKVVRAAQVKLFG